MKYYVDRKAAAKGDGSQQSPFQTINEAAQVAMPGDEVVVFPGIYREWVDPRNAGTGEQRIVYRSVVPLKAVISGAEPVESWTQFEGDVWKTEIDNAVFTDRNPYTTMVSGDWFMAYFKAHTGEVFLNDKALYEVTELEGVLHPQPSKTSWDPDFSVYTWYTEQDEERDKTVLYANFHGLDPNQEKTEFSARSSCFYPREEGIGYITLSGFAVEKAATQWAPPTAYQEGMVGPHWSKGWIIEDCEISNSKCSGISLGKYLQPENDNKWLKWKYKDGTQTERDCICQAQIEGWTKERIGSHIVRRCHIHDCGQTGIVGHLGGVFSLIEDNHIHHINNRQNLAGAEIGGIKMHAAIDCVFRRNHIHNCTRGLWLDWQAQGTRVTQNFFHDNTLPFDHLMCPEALAARGEDIFIEVSHGPTLVDNNILLSDRSLKLPTQGVAVVHNLIAGAFACVGRGVNNGSLTKISPRYTPYHVPHRTEIAGFMTILHGDMRFYNNLFVQRPVRPFLQKLSEIDFPSEWDDGNALVGTKPYDGYMTFEEWDRQFDGYCGMGSEASDRYYNPLPVWSEGNVYVGGAQPCDLEKGARICRAEEPLEIRAACRDGKWYLDTQLFDLLPEDLFGERIDTEKLGMAFEPEEKYENPDGTPIIFEEDYFGKFRNRISAGPFADLQDGRGEIFG
ncbi:MAG: right-handed parallel beta-helix repeat-containing protein [Lachnospiraceae bacterium]|nr:right-handed parallel beta-helix repeat-containing protein [Lachnospiraceae bacterium]